MYVQCFGCNNYLTVDLFQGVVHHEKRMPGEQCYIFAEYRFPRGMLQYFIFKRKNNVTGVANYVQYHL